MGQHFRIDLDKGGGLDDLSISNPAMVRIERMADSSFWGCITMADGREVELGFWTKGAKLHAKAERRA